MFERGVAGDWLGQVGGVAESIGAALGARLDVELPWSSGVQLSTSVAR